MSVLKKILLSLVVFIMVATGTALSFVPFYNRTPFRIGVGIILAVILYIVLLKSLVWRKEMSRYDDIINLPHHVSPTRKRMSLHDRAAQFAPFAALVGYDDAVAETARLTESRPELDEQEQRVINERLAYIADHIHEQRKFVSNTLSRMNTNQEGQLLRFPARSKKYLLRTEQSLWQMVAKYDYQTSQI